MSAPELIPDQKAVAGVLLASAGLDMGPDERRSPVQVALDEIGAGRLDPEVARQAGLVIEAPAIGAVAMPLPPREAYRTITTGELDQEEVDQALAKGAQIVGWGMVIPAEGHTEV